MPLIHSKSKTAFAHNVRAEIKAGRPRAQAVAIAYSIQRGNKMAKRKRKAVRKTKRKLSKKARGNTPLAKKYRAAKAAYKKLGAALRRSRG